MRALADADRIRRFMRALGDAATADTRVYFTGGATAVLHDRSPFIAREGRVAFHHFDLYAQALAKIERGHVQDLADVRQMLAAASIESMALRSYFEAIEPYLYRYPAVDPGAFRRAVEQVAARA